MKPKVPQTKIKKTKQNKTSKNEKHPPQEFKTASRHLNDSGETQHHKILKIRELLKELQFPVAKWM